MKVLYGVSSNEVGVRIAEWFANQQNKPIYPPYSNIIWFKDDKPVGAVLFNDYTGSSIEVHFHLPGLLNREVLSIVAKYVFDQSKCNTLIGRIHRKNKALLNVINRLGFKYLAVIPQYFGPDKQDDAILYYTNKEMFYNKWVR